MFRGYTLGDTESSCPYIDGQTFLSESYLIEDVNKEEIDLLLDRGYRHFGKFFFRPVCRSCHRCLPIRIPVERYVFSRNARRLFKRYESFRIDVVDNPEVSEEKFLLYKEHKKRFRETEDSETGVEEFQQFSESFFTNFSFSKTIEIRDKYKLIAVTHMDDGLEANSAIYCYYNTDYLSLSPGRFSIYKGIELAKNSGKRYYYLGYYVEGNSHMSYKGAYTPNEVLLQEGMWTDGPPEGHEFHPLYRLI